MSVHISVLMNEVIEGLDLRPNDIVIDGTVNGGGHAQVITKHLSSKGVFVGIDQDSKGLDVSAKVLDKVKPTVHLVHENTRHIDRILDDLNIDSYNKILLDLGWSSNQFEDPMRGFSFNKKGPLIMSLSDKDAPAFTAADIVNTWEQQSMTDIFQGYGDEKFAWRIAGAIVERRAEGEITDTLQLAEIIRNAIPKKFHGKTHPATKVFQALRIAVNDEMQVLREILEKGWERLAPGGRMVIISFHSTEDRIVKHYFKQKKEEGAAALITKRPITAAEEELSDNPRSRSAKLRILQKI